MRLVLALLALFALPASASTVRFEFDAGPGERWWSNFDSYDGGSATQSEVAASLHQLGSIIGMSGRVVLEFEHVEDTTYASNQWTGTCVSGFICADGEFLSPSRPNAFTPYDRNDLTQGFRPATSGIEWAIDVSDGELTFFDDILIEGFTEFEGFTYNLLFQSARFPISNTTVSPIPLPAGALLLLSGLSVFRSIRRQSKSPGRYNRLSAA